MRKIVMMAALAAMVAGMTSCFNPNKEYCWTVTMIVPTPNGNTVTEVSHFWGNEEECDAYQTALILKYAIEGTKVSATPSRTAKEDCKD